MGNISSSILASTPVSTDILHVPFQVLLSFLRIFRILFPLNGPVGSKATRQFVSAMWHPDWLQCCCTGSACRSSNVKHPNCCVHSGQYLVLQNWWSVRKKITTKFSVREKNTYKIPTQFYTSAFCWPQVSYQDVIIPPLVIVSDINIQLQLMNFIMKHVCPSENIIYPKDFSPCIYFVFLPTISKNEKENLPLLVKAFHSGWEPKGTI